MQEDENIRVVSLIRTADNKFYRIGIENPDEELTGGFPTTREELFGYRGLILGSIEASFFTLDQLRMIAAFVSERGGGLLMLGGRRAFSEGGYAETPVGDVLPIVLEPVEGEEQFFSEVDVEITPAGRTHPITQIAGTIEESEHRWGELPPLTVVNRVTQTKPGATTLLTGDRPGMAESQIVLAYQRYGRGRVMVLPVQDSWTWQMHADIPLDDMTHETFWRQLLRWTVASVPDRVQVTSAVDRVAVGEPVELLAVVEDDTYLKVNNTEVRVRVRSPSGAVDSLTMDWTVDRDGEYRARFVPREEGLYEIRADAEEGGEFLASDASYVQVKDPAREYFDAEMQAPTLRRIADETGGHFYTSETVSTLPEDIMFTDSGTTVVERRDLWDMPAIFLVLILLVSAEWGYRRTRGLA